jgi:integrase
MAEFERDKDGNWPVRVRFGHGRAKRMVISGALSMPEAKARLARLREMGDIVSALPHDEAVEFLRDAALAEASELPDLFAVAKEQAARESGAAMAPDAKAVTFEDFAERWVSGELAKLYPGQRGLRIKASVRGDEAIFRVLKPVIGKVKLHLFSLADAHRAIRALPEMTEANRRHYRQFMNRVLNLAVYPAGIIKANPLPQGFVGSKPPSREKTYLYPVEDEQLLTGPAPFGRRLFYGFKGRTGLRLSEAMKLRVRHFDFRTGEMRVEKAITTTNKRGRKFVVRDDVWQALDILFGKADPDTPLFQPLGGRNPWEQFHRDLRASGCTRHALYEDTDTRQPIRVHDLRATFITLALLEGRDLGWIMLRTGHSTLENLRAYEREATHAKDMGLSQLGPLDELLGLRQKPNRKKYSGGDMRKSAGGIGGYGAGASALLGAPAEFTSSGGDAVHSNPRETIGLGPESKGPKADRGAPLAQVIPLRRRGR